MAESILTASNIKKSFGKNIAINNVSIKVERGEILGLLGPNGAGKTTLAKILVGLLKADKGTVEYFGEKQDARAGKVRERIGMVPQEPSFYQSFTVKQNIEFFASLYGSGNKVAKTETIWLIKWLNLSRFTNHKARVLSGGYKRLLNIACSLVNNPDIIFLDEPTVGLDPKMRQTLWNKINELRDSGKTILLTTHYMDEAEELCDRVAMMSSGKIAVIDDPENLIAEYGGKAVLIFKLNKNVELDLIVKIKEAMPGKIVRNVQSTLILPTEQSNVTPVIVKLSKIINEAGYEINGSLVKEPELEDVFLNITGKAIKE
ncbi:MAG: ABC transporter ATP-binding protein [archaeon]|jgi:ABC-2 type transport system ATP-binding protein|nr:ABC transporter ATP-binding protein [archaeon]